MLAITWKECVLHAKAREGKEACKPSEPGWWESVKGDGMLQARQHLHLQTLSARARDGNSTAASGGGRGGLARVSDCTLLRRSKENYCRLLGGHWQNSLDSRGTQKQLRRSDSQRARYL